ncbi:hypothetical protein D3C85_1849310 [compost metagenome]
MDAEGFFAPAIGLTRHIDDSDQGAFLRFVLVSSDDLIHRLGQTPAFEQTDLTMASADKTVFRVSHHGDKPHRLPDQ